MDVYQAPECQVVLEARAEQPLRLRAGEAREVRLHFGRIAEYPWLSSLVARQASSSRVWDPVGGRPRGESAESYLANTLRSVPEFTALFDRWSVVSVSAEKVLLKPAAELPLAAGAPLPPGSRLPYDALLIVGLQR